MPAVPPIPRRSFLQSLAGAAVLGAAPAALADDKGPDADILQSRTPPDFQVLDLTVEGDKKLAQRFVLLIPKHLAKDERAPLLVLLHGLGETWESGVGVYAWLERYGLGAAYARLRRPPIAHTSRNTTLLPDAHIAELNAALTAQPFRGMVIACPFTPNVSKAPSPSAALDTYADWIADVVIPRARKEAPVIPDAAHTSIDGVSLGGSVGLEVFVRRPSSFGLWGGVQSAINLGRIPVYVEKLGAAAAAKGAKGAKGAKAQALFHLETSLSDPMRDLNQALSNELTKKGVAHDFVVLPGQHDQLFLREAGAMEMLLWHDRRLR